MNSALFPETSIGGFFFEAVGAGLPLVLVHVWGCWREHMRGLAELFGQTHRVYSIDLPPITLSVSSF